MSKTDILGLVVSMKLIRLFLYFILPPKLFAKNIGVTLGHSCRIVSKRFGSEPYLIKMGNHVHITKGVEFVTHDGGVWVFRDEIPNCDVFGEIVIGNNVYIGNNSVILPGIKIGDNCVIGANSLVSKSIPSNSVVAGNPIRFIKTLKEYETKIMKYNINSKGLSYGNKKSFILEKNTFLERNEIMNKALDSENTKE